MPAKRDVTMRVAVLLMTCLVFATLLALDTGALLSWALSWMVRGVAHWWALLSVPLAIVAVHPGTGNAAAHQHGLAPAVRTHQAAPPQDARKSPYLRGGRGN